jgi:hypothetical protein
MSLAGPKTVLSQWPLWTKTCKDQAISLVSIPLQKRAEEYVILKKFNVW